MTRWTRSSLLVGGAMTLLASLQMASAAAQAVKAQPAGAPGLVVVGQVAYPQSYTLPGLEELSATTVGIDLMSEHGVRHATYTGVLLRTLLDRASLTDAPGRKTHLRHIVLAKGADGYTVALAIGEIDPRFEGKQVIVAWTQDGKPLDGLELVVPGDKHAGRYVKNLVSLAVN